MRRREFIGLVGSVAAAWPVAASAQQSDRMRRVGLLSGGRADDPEIQARVTAFVQALQQMGWTDGRNVRIDYRWGEGDADTIRKSTAELVALSPDVILTPGGPALERLRRVTRTIPIVFVITPDPVGSSVVKVCRGRAATPLVLCIRIQFVRQMAGTTEGDCAGYDAGGGPA